MTGGALANIVISSGAVCRYGADGKRFDDTLSREISRVMLPVPPEGEISPLRSASVEMTGGMPANIVISSGAACRYGADGKRSHDTLSREISRVMLPVPSEEGDFSTLWRLCIESPSQPKLASSLYNKRLSYWRLTGFRRNDGGRGPAFLKSAAKPPPPPFEPFEPSEPYEPFEPSHRRCVHWCSPTSSSRAGDL